MKKLLPLFMGTALLTGCSSHGNVNDKAYLRAASADGKQMTFAFYSEEDELLTITADNPENAKSAAELALGKEIFTGHTELLILNDCDQLELLDYILHEWKVSPSCMVIETEDSGEELLKKRKPEQITGEIKTAQKKGLADKCDIVTVLSSLLKEDKK